MADRPISESNPHPNPSHYKGGSIGAVVARELRRIRAEKIYPLLMFILPLIGFFLIVSTFQERVPHDLPVAVFDGDNTPLSRDIIRSVNAARTIQISQHISDQESAEAWLREGRGYAVLIIPEGLQSSVYSGRAHPVVAYINGQWLLPASLVSRDLLQSITTVSKRLDAAKHVAKGASVSQAAQRVNPIKTDAVALFNPHLDYVTYLVLALIPTLLQIFVMIMTVHSVGIELKRGSAGEWMDAAGGSIVRALVGKLIPYWITSAALLAIIWVILFQYLNIAIQGSIWLVLATMVLLILACQSIGIAFVALTSNLRFATSITSFYTGPAFAFTGITFPAVGMPLIARVWGLMIPLTHALSIITEQVVMGAPSSVSLPKIGVLMLFVLLSLATLPRLKGLLLNPQCWGKV